MKRRTGTVACAALALLCSTAGWSSMARAAEEEMVAAPKSPKPQLKAAPPSKSASQPKAASQPKTTAAAGKVTAPAAPAPAVCIPPIPERIPEGAKVNTYEDIVALDVKDLFPAQDPKDPKDSN